MTESSVFDRIATDLAREGWSVTPNLLSREDANAIRRAFEGLDEAGRFRQAGIGRADTARVDATIRGDRILWLDEGDAQGPLHAVWNALSALRVHLNRSLFLGLREIEAHAAIYPAGRGYDKHLDRPVGSERRVVSFVLYLNDLWRLEHGGQLRLYSRGNPNVVAADVEPRLSTLACFLSGEIEHEVLATTETRYSLTGWFLAE